MSSSSVSSETALVSLGFFDPLRLTFQAAQNFRTQSDEPSICLLSSWMVYESSGDSIPSVQSLMSLMLMYSEMTCTTKPLLKLLTHCLQLIVRTLQGILERYRKENCKVNSLCFISNSSEVTNKLDKLMQEYRTVLILVCSILPRPTQNAHEEFIGNALNIQCQDTSSDFLDMLCLLVYTMKIN